MRLAKEAERQEAYAGYTPKLIEGTINSIANHIYSCMIALPNSSVESFMLVADITPSGRAANVEVSLATDLTTCIAEKFGSLQFLKPPKYPGRVWFPIAHEFKNQP